MSRILSRLPGLILILIAALLTACTPALNPALPIDDQRPILPTSPDDIVVSPPDQPMPPDKEDPYAPKPSDAKLTRGTAYIDSAQLVIMESYPVQIALVLSGSLPTPCHKLRVLVNPPDTQNRIQVEVYTVSKPDEICIQVLEAFDVNISLGSYPTGHYTVWVNSEQIGEFDS